MSFLFAVCQPGSERALKGELARLRPDLRPAFARPGLVTWKTDAPLSLSEPADLVFARAWGVSLGAADSPDQVAVLARTTGATRLHVFPRDEADPAPVRAALVGTGPFQQGERPRAGEVVLDVIVADGEPWWVGAHLHARGRSPFPGGLIQVDVPDVAPSRAYRKIEEALAWSGARVRAGETALEIGSAPGGAAYALLRRGLTVVGVDPGDMDPIVVAEPGFRHIKVAVGGLRREDVPDRVDWLLLDVNLAAQVALHSIRRIVPMVRRGLRGAFFTLKLNEEAFAAEVPAFLERVRQMGFATVRATQLPSNRREICVHAT